jgi:hypothetical protein
MSRASLLSGMLMPPIVNVIVFLLDGGCQGA